MRALKTKLTTAVATACLSLAAQAGAPCSDTLVVAAKPGAKQPWPADAAYSNIVIQQPSPNGKAVFIAGAPVELHCKVVTNGSLTLFAPAGVLISENGDLQVAGALELRAGEGKKSATGSIVNAGRVLAGKSVALVGAEIVNAGTALVGANGTLELTANRVTLASTSSLAVEASANPKSGIVISSQADVVLAGQVLAPGGSLVVFTDGDLTQSAPIGVGLLSAQAAGDIALPDLHNKIYVLAASKAGGELVVASQEMLIASAIQANQVLIASAGALHVDKTSDIRASSPGDALVLSAKGNLLVDSKAKMAANQGRRVFFTANWTDTTLPPAAGAHRYGCVLEDCPGLTTTKDDVIGYAAQPTLTVRPVPFSRQYRYPNPAEANRVSTEGAVNGDEDSLALLDRVGKGKCTPGQDDTCWYVRNLAITGNPDVKAPVGTYTRTIAPTLSSTLGYKIVYEPGTAEVTPRKLSVVADSLTIDQGAPLPKFTYKTTGLLEADKVKGGLSTDADTSQSGVYSISLGTFSVPAHYEIDFTPGTLTVR